MSRRLSATLFDGAAVLTGATLTTLALLALDPAQASGLGAVAHSSVVQPTLLVMGLLLSTLPGSRRVFWPTLFAQDDLSECHDVADALCRVGLQQRVQAANLYMNDLSDEALDRAFEGDNGIMEWFRPTLADHRLSNQIDPLLLKRLEVIARRSEHGLQG
ncbi:hypothetical protein GALL_313290 [mine drainage metagenome]|uniref:Uncharacterized protein n=1 Tax=mine drainage metagenome TaxID=410659 RepID=A0A1J5RFB8_9ZZZZ